MARMANENRMRRRSSGTFAMLENPPKTAIRTLSVLFARSLGSGRSNHHHFASGRLDLHARALAELVRRHRQGLGEVAVPENLDLVDLTLDQADLALLQLTDLALRVKALERRHVHDDGLLGERHA